MAGAGAYGSADDAGGGWDLPRRVGDVLQDRGGTLAVAESCTGGLVASMVTDVPGASDLFVLGVVAYAADAKVEVLGVDPGLIDGHGAVSEAVAAAMARGVRDLAGATWGLSTTGVAGPDGGTEETPVGTLCVGVVGPGDAGEARTSRHELPGDRDRLEMKTRMAARALQDLLRTLEGE